ncbi:hypothetical protein SALBM217S_02453 [Streptomyces griseoloalbus]
MRTAAALVAAGSLLLATPASAARTPASATEARGTAVAAARAASEGIGFGPCAEEQELPPTVECGTLRVPLDYARPDGERIPLTVSRSRATGQDPATGRAVPRQGSLVDNPGGPGVSGMYFPMLGMAPDWKRLAAAYDLVGYAPRGVGRSAPLSCTDPKTFQQGPAPAPQHPSARVKRERAARAEAYARGCAERSGDALRHYTSLNNARDLDVLRAALGETRLTFLGSSYGTYIGALYATLFPSHVRRMVFDSAVNPAPERIWYRNNLAQSAAFEDRWADFRAWVARQPRRVRAGRHPGRGAGQLRPGAGAAGADACGREGRTGAAARGDAEGGVLRRPLAAARARPVGVSEGRSGAAGGAGGGAPRGGGGGGEHARGVSGGGVQRRALAGGLRGMGPGQHAAGAPGAVRDVGQRVDQPALCLLAGAEAAPARTWRAGARAPCRPR